MLNRHEQGLLCNQTRIFLCDSVNNVSWHFQIGLMVHLVLKFKQVIQAKKSRNQDSAQSTSRIYSGHLQATSPSLISLTVNSIHLKNNHNQSNNVQMLKQISNCAMAIPVLAAREEKVSLSWKWFTINKTKYVVWSEWERTVQRTTCECKYENQGRVKMKLKCASNHCVNRITHNDGHWAKKLVWGVLCQEVNETWKNR